MAESESAKRIRAAKEFCRPYRVSDGKRFRLKDFSPSDVGPFKSRDKATAKERAGSHLKAGVQLLAEYQEKLYAQDTWAVLLVFQAMDAAGKDSAIEHVMSGVNPQGCQVHSFKAPTSTDLDHDYLWRTHAVMPERGRIGIFNRSYYEEVLVVRVHPELLGHQKLPATVVGDDIWKNRYADINAHEKYLTRNGVAIRKFFLNVSKKEQKERFLSRLDEPAKNWKFSEDDVRERGFWDDYQKAYQDMIRATATPHAPWFVVPADSKWYARLVVAAAIIEAMDSLNLKYPTVSKARAGQLAVIRKKLQSSD